MNKQELIKKYEDTIYAIIATDEVLRDLKQLDEPIKLKDVIKRIKDLDIDARKVWIDAILNELGSDYGSKKYRDGYEQGKFDGAMKREKVTVKQFVADWIEVCKEHLPISLHTAMDLNFMKQNNQSSDLMLWIEKSSNQEIFAQAWIFGYTVEKEKRYLVKMKGMVEDFTVLKLDKIRDGWYLGNDTEYSYTKVKHTRKELEEVGFGEVFNSPLFELEEVEE